VPAADEMVSPLTILRFRASHPAPWVGVSSDPAGRFGWYAPCRISM
jgi:hypothetical protein